jgi:hypothetical protein
MERERDSERDGSGGNKDQARKGRGSSRRGTMSVAGWVVTALVSTLAMGISGASGCGDTIDSKGQTETAGQREALGEAQQAAAMTATKCIVINSASTTHNGDTMISLEKPDNNNSLSDDRAGRRDRETPAQAGSAVAVQVRPERHPARTPPSSAPASSSARRTTALRRRPAPDHDALERAHRHLEQRSTRATTPLVFKTYNTDLGRST